jgi:hypothetical protein
MKLVTEPGAEEHILAAVDVLFTDRLGPDITDDAKRYCPVDTGHLRDSGGHHLDGHTLVVAFTAGYAPDVEMGHRVAHGPHMQEVGPKVVGPRPYMRPALYQERG